MRRVRKTLLALAVLSLALQPFASHAASHAWNGSASNAWENTSNWTGGVPSSTTGNPDTISAATNNPVQINTAVNIGTNSLTFGSSSNSLNINSGDSFTGGAVTLNGASITGTGSFHASSISGFGTISAPLTGSISFTANATDGTNFGGFSPFVNGTPGTPLTLNNQTLTNASFTISNHGDFTLNNVTLNGASLNGVSTNLNAGSAGGNNYYGLINMTGTNNLNGTITRNNYEVFSINSGTTNLNGATISGFATNTPGPFIINGGTLNNASGNSTIGTGPLTMNGGAITNTGGGTFSTTDNISGYGSISGLSLGGGGHIVATGGTMTVNGGSSANPASLGSTSGAGAGFGASANSVLDLQGNFNIINPLNISPTGTTGIVQLDGLTTTNSGSWATTLNAGAVNVVNSSTLSGPVISTSTLTLDPSTKLTVNGNYTDSGTMVFDIDNLSSYGMMDVTGMTTIAGGTIDIDLLSSPQAGYYDLFDSTGGISGWSSATLDISGLAPGFTAQIVPEYNGSNIVEEGLQISQTPEPGTMLLMGLGLAGAAFLRKRMLSAN
jgi:hypothetical protein